MLSQNAMTAMHTTLLGTSAAHPTRRRGLSAAMVRAHRDRLLVDCGEGTLRQMLRFGTGLRIDAVLFTHFHADHYLGIVGLLRTLSMHDHDRPIHLYGPGTFVSETLSHLVHIGIEKLAFETTFTSLDDGDIIERDGYVIRAVGVDHRVPTVAYSIEEKPHPGRFDVSAARALGIPEGPLFKKLQNGESVRAPSGELIASERVVGAPRRGRKICFSGDTRPSAELAEAAAGADLLVHEATFSERERERAEITKHSTAAEAARIASEAQVRKLVLTHLSSRYDTKPKILFDEAREVFDGDLSVAEDGLDVEISTQS